MEEAGFVQGALGALFRSGPQVAADEHLEEQSQMNKSTFDPVLINHNATEKCLADNTLLWDEFKNKSDESHKYHLCANMVTPVSIVIWKIVTRQLPNEVLLPVPQNPA